MKEWIIYLLKMTVCSAVLLLYYLVALRNKSFNRYNRLFLLISVAISLILPLIHIPIYWQGNAVKTPLYIQTLKAIEVHPFMPEGAAWMSASLLFYSYFAVSAVILLSLLSSIRKIRKLRNQYPCKRIDNISVYETNEQNTPFTFMNHIFWNSKLPIDSQIGQQVFRHEWLHASQRHTLDLVFMKIVLAIAWINPFFYILRNELLAVHEFSADEFATNKSDKKVYAEALITEAIQQKNHIPVAHHFYHSPFKRRIYMLSLPSTPRNFSYMRKTMIIPVVAGILGAFSFNTRVQSTDPRENTDAVELTVNDRQAQYPGGASAWMNFLVKTLHYPDAAVKGKIEGAVVLQFTVDAEGNVSNIEAIAGPSEGGLREESIRVLKASGKWLPAIKNDKPVTSVKKQPFVYRLNDKDKK